MGEIISKAWNWDEVKEIHWRIPAEETYYLRLRWEKLDFEEFLDLGCGAGRHALFFAEDGYTVSAFDLSNTGLTELTNKANEMGLEIDTKCGDMLNLPYENRSFDCILAYHSLYHTKYSSLKDVLKKIYDLLIEGGEFYVTLNSKKSPSFTNPTNIIVDDRTIIKTEGNEAGIVHTYIDEKDIVDLIEPFHLVSMRHIQKFYNDETSFHYHLLLRK